MTGYKVPKLGMAITTYELVEGAWVATVTHTFYGDSKDELNAIMEAHKKTDAFFAGSFEGKFNGISLRNSEPRTYVARLENHF